MRTAIVTILAMWAALAAGTALWMWAQNRWARYQHGEQCACGLFDLDGIEAQWTEVAVHQRDLCAPLREVIR